MNRPATKVDQIHVTRATDDAISYRDDVVRRALEAMTDPQKDQRMKQHECIRCFYLVGRVGCSAMTNQPCGVCGKNQVYGSSCTDVVCATCAEKNELCKHCGGDIKLRPRRKYQSQSSSSDL